MPEIGETTRRDRVSLGGRMRIVWSSCPECGKERWCPVKTPNQLCQRCSTRRIQPLGAKAKKPKQSINQTGAGNRQWKGGRKCTNGYICVLIYSNNPYYPMAQATGYVLEHRLVVAQELGRCLLPQEKVHHKDGDKTNNTKSNLELLSQADHNTYKQMCAHCELRKEVRLLKWRIKELNLQLQKQLI